MELPKGKGPKLPPKGRGGGAAARQRHLERQRGLEVAEPAATEPVRSAPAGSEGAGARAKGGAGSDRVEGMTRGGKGSAGAKARRAKVPREGGDGGC